MANVWNIFLVSRFYFIRCFFCLFLCNLFRYAFVKVNIALNHSTVIFRFHFYGVLWQSLVLPRAKPARRLNAYVSMYVYVCIRVCSSPNRKLVLSVYLLCRFMVVIKWVTVFVEQSVFIFAKKLYLIEIYLHCNWGS